jgi:hypothetical protein
MTLLELVEDYAANRCEAVAAMECAGPREVDAANAAAANVLKEIQRRYDAAFGNLAGLRDGEQIRAILDGKS